MLEIFVPAQRLFNEETEEFIYTKEVNLKLEHSLVSISKWESKYKKPFLSKDSEKTDEELNYYVQCMSLDENIDNSVFLYLPSFVIDKVDSYINDSMTATVINDPQGGNGGRKSSEFVTSELIYFWMISYQIPVEFENWHLNRLLTLINICQIKNQPPKKMNRSEMLSKRAAENARRKAMLGTRG